MKFRAIASKRPLIWTFFSMIFMLLTGVFFTQQTKAPAGEHRAEYAKWLENHPFNNRPHLTKADLKKIPKKDRPDLAMEQNFLQTVDPELKIVPSERLVTAYNRMQSLKNTGQYYPGSSWAERGPSNVGGRTRAIMFDPNDGTGKKVFAAGVAGGIWYTNDITDAGEGWTQVNDFLDNLAVCSIDYDPSNTSVFYAGTGEGYYNVDAVRGAGIWKSTNGGSSWTQLAATNNYEFDYVQKVKVHPTTGHVYAATKSRYSNVGGIYRSTDGGSTWAVVLNNDDGASSYRAADIEFGADGTIYATMGLIFSTDGIYSSSTGNSGDWTKLNTGTNGFPTTGIERIEIATAPSNANYIYALTQSSSTDGIEGVYRSTDKGANWSSLTLPNDVEYGTEFSRGQAWYDLALAVDPNDEDAVFTGAINLFKTTNGGSSWTQISHWYGGFSLPYVHADHHTIVFKPGSSSEIVFGSDGGVDYTANGTSSTPSFTNRNNGYNVTQFYSGAIHPGDGENYFLAGAQDNGTQKFNSAGIDATDEVTGGDGAFCFIDQTDPTYQVTSYVYNNFRRSTNSGASFSNITADNSGSFINPADYDDNLDILYSARTSTTLKRISGITGTISESTISVSMDNVASHIRVSPYTSGSTTLFVGTGSGSVYKVTNANGSPTTTYIDAGNDLPSGSVSCIEIGASENELLVTFSNFGVTSVWYTSDGGANWTSKEGDLPDMPVRWALFNPDNRNVVLLATELGVWATADLSTDPVEWQPYNNGLANVRVDMLQIRDSDKMVIAATHGRGLFSNADFTTDTSLPVELAAFTATPGNAQVTLNWQTHSEVNNQGFEIYRSDAENGEYQKIASHESDPALAGNGNSNESHSYRFTDKWVSNGSTYWYQLADVSFNGERDFHPAISAIPNASNTPVVQSAAGPASYELQQNYPNPFNPETTVKFSLAAQHKSDQNVKVLVFNALGQQVRELYNGTLQPGTYEMKWDGRNQSGELLGSGTYFAMLQTGFFRETRKMLLIK
ncbi:MAG: hypothetical protein KDH98_21585 [Calditrichaeota bacterium]|nr:hypothetical protein [Calditrichota bacterium]